MIAFLADENLKRQVISGLLRRNPLVDVVRVQDAGLTGAENRTLLEWAAEEDRVLPTHDVQTLVGFAWEFVRLRKPMAGVIVLGKNLRVSEAVEEILLIAECSHPEEWAGVVAYLPLQNCFPRLGSQEIALATAVTGWFYGRAYRQAQSIRASMVTHALVVTLWRA